VVLVPGSATGGAHILTEPLSFWGGFDAATGRIIDRRHPQHGAQLSGRVLVMPGGRGSSSASSVLAEAIRRGTAPAAIVLREPDQIIAIGALVAGELYERWCPVAAVDAAAYDALQDGAVVTVTATADGQLRIS
jgi:predicted aconitase with swiveling domain